jgi:peptide/nickel transport system permease protein
MTVIDKQVSTTYQNDDYKKIAWHSLYTNPTAMAGIVIFIILVTLALFGSRLTPYSPNEAAGNTFLSPRIGYWMGTDNLGRDEFTRFLQGVKVSLIVGIGAASFSIIIGVIIGSIAGYIGGWVDVICMRLADIFLTIPMIVLGLVIAAFFGKSIIHIIVIIGILSWPSTARLVRSEFLKLRESEFVQAAVAIGSSNLFIVFREILPNAFPTVLVNWSLEVGRAIVLEAGLSYLGVGDPSGGSWGMMLQDAQRFLRQGWWLSVFPGVGIAISALSANFIGEGLNDALNPKLISR